MPRGVTAPIWKGGSLIGPSAASWYACSKVIWSGAAVADCACAKRPDVKRDTNCEPAAATLQLACLPAASAVQDKSSRMLLSCRMTSPAAGGQCRQCRAAASVQRGSSATPPQRAGAYLLDEFAEQDRSVRILPAHPASIYLQPEANVSCAEQQQACRLRVAPPRNWVRVLAGCTCCADRVMQTSNS